MRRLLVALVLLLAGVPAWAGTILVLGDSLSAGYGVPAGEGWVDLLRERLQERGRPCEVVNASISGDTSAGGRARVDQALTEHEPAILILELGANDGLRGLSLPAMKRNLSSIIERAKAAGAQVLLLGMQLPPNYGPRYTERFAAIYRELAREHDLPPPPFLLEEVALRPELMQPDNLHPNAAGQPFLLQTVWPHLQPLLSD